MPAPTMKSSTRSRRCRGCFRGFLEFGYIVLTTSSAHGLKHVVSKYHYLERLLWVAVVASGALGAAWLSLSTWHRYQLSPTVISLEKNYLDWNTTFPATTFCPVYRIDRMQAEIAAEEIFPSVSPAEGALKLESLVNATYTTFDKVEDLPGLSPNQYLEVYLSLLFNFTFSLTNSNSEPTSVTRVLNEMGICYTYNSLIADQMDPEYEKSRRKEEWFMPEATLFRGNPLDGDIFAQVMDMSSPVNLAIHGAEDFPEEASKWHITEEKNYLTLELSALSIYSSLETRALSVSQRKCRFLEESNLETSPVYSYNLCRAECRMRLAYKLCGCIPYFYRNNGAYKICGVPGMRCLSKHKDWLRRLRRRGGQKEKCGCYPSCDDDVYTVQGKEAVVWYLGTNFKYGLIKYPTIRLKRDVVFGVYDLLVQFGGTVGLCLGCSVLSIAEFGYFLTFRLFIFIWKKFK